MGIFGFKKSIRKEMMAYFIIGSFLPVAISLFVLSGFYQKILHETLIRDAQLSRRVLNTELQHLIDRLKAAVIAGSRASITTELLSAGKDDYDSLGKFAAHLKETTIGENISFYDTEGRSLFSSDMDRGAERLDGDLIDRIESKKTEETPALVNMDMDIERGIRVDVYAPVIEPFYAYLQAIMREDVFIDKRFLAEMKVRTETEFVLFGQGKAVFSTFASLPVIDPSNYNEAIRTKRTVSRNVLKIHGAEYHALFVPVTEGDGVPGVIGIFISEEPMKKSVDFSRMMFFVVFLGIIIFSFGINRFSTNKIVTPILSTVKALHRISRGELKYRVDLKSRNELGELGNSFNRMAGDLETSETELVAAKDYTDNIIKSMIDTLIVVSPDAMIQTINKATSDLLGYKKEELIGKPVATIFAEEERTFKGTELRKLIKRGSMSNYEVNFKTRDGNKIPMLLSEAAMRDKKGGITDIVCVAKDITERKKSEKEKENLQKQLFQSQKMESVGIMANGIAHNFNNILGAIRGYADMAFEDTPQGERVRSYLKQIIEGSEDAKEIVAQMLSFSRQDKYDLKATHIHPVVQNAVELFSASMTSPVEVRQNIDVSCGAVLADANQIQQVVMNLCSNGYHAMREGGGALEVSMNEVNVGIDLASRYPNLHEGRYVRLSISDTGHGMEQDTIDHIFEPFFTTKEVGRGTGLGLSMVHGIVMNHKGEITVDSEQGKGTTFNVYLPLADDNQDKKEA